MKKISENFEIFPIQSQYCILGTLETEIFQTKTSKTGVEILKYLY